MKTVFDAIDYLFTIISESPLQGAITGNIYKVREPQGSTLENIVVTCSAPIGQQQINALGIVNIYVPPIPIKTNGQNKQFQPDIDRMRDLMQIAMDVLADNMDAQNYQRAYVNSGGIMEDTDGRFFINIRVNYLGFNLTNN